MQDQRPQLGVCLRRTGRRVSVAVADRLGLWGPYGRPNVAWGDMEHFLTYVEQAKPVVSERDYSGSWMGCDDCRDRAWHSSPNRVSDAMGGPLSGYLLLAFASA